MVMKGYCSRDSFTHLGGRFYSLEPVRGAEKKDVRGEGETVGCPQALTRAPPNRPSAIRTF